MSNGSGNDFGKFLLALAGVLLGVAVIERLTKPIHRCPYPNCRVVVQPYVPCCPHCGRPIKWEQ